MSSNIISLLPTISTSAASFDDIYTITPHFGNASSRLVLTHATSEISVVDAGTLQIVKCLRGVHEDDVSCVVTSTSSAQAYTMTDDLCPTETHRATCDQGGIWTAGKDGKVVNWDERFGSAGQVITADLKGPLPLLSMALHERENLVVGGSELTAYESHILFWDDRNVSSPLYTHSTTHTDDITHLQFLPPSDSDPTNSVTTDIPSLLLLSASYDGVVSITDAKVAKGDDAIHDSVTLDGCIEKAGWYRARADKMQQRRQDIKIWARSDMDSVGTWKLGRGSERDAMLQDHMFHPVHTFEPLSFFTPPLISRKPRTRFGKRLPSVNDSQLGRRQVDHIACDYMIDVCPSLGINARTGESMVALGNNSGDIVIVQHAKTQQPTTQRKTELDEKDYGKYGLCAILHTPKDGSAGHKDVVRCIYHDIRSRVVYSGSRDGVLSGWSIPLSGLQGDLSNTDEVCNEGRNISPNEDQEEDDQMVVDEEFGKTGDDGDTLFKGQTSKRMRRLTNEGDREWRTDDFRSAKR